eukprot:754200-Hanusia_phi.AAC.2
MKIRHRLALRWAQPCRVGEWGAAGTVPSKAPKLRWWEDEGNQLVGVRLPVNVNVETFPRGSPVVQDGVGPPTPTQRPHLTTARTSSGERGVGTPSDPIKSQFQI